MRLVPIAAAPVLVVLGYPDMPTAADAVPALLAHAPLAIEGMDSRLVDVVRRVRGASAVPAAARRRRVAHGRGRRRGPRRGPASGRTRSRPTPAPTAVGLFPPGPEAAAMWRIREDGAGLGGRTPSGEQAWPGFEDSAVPPERLGAYLRELEALMASHGVDGLAYGHFGDGCVHLRLDIPLERSGNPLRAFMTDAATLVASHGGSLSGEHGDGRARSELLPVMYSPKAIDLFGAFKDLLDPRDLLNPGVLVRPRPLDADLRRPWARPLLADGHGFSFAHDAGDLTTALHRCVGVGKCRADSTATGGFMCPSYLATKDEKDSTRGRARVLQEMANGTLVSGGWSSPEVHESLDLCLSCKACSSDCPAGVDMAQYKSEVLHRTYRGKLRPMSHYALGWLPRWARLITGVPGLAALTNAVLGVRPVATRGARGRRHGHPSPDGDVRPPAVPRVGPRRGSRRVTLTRASGDAAPATTDPRPPRRSRGGRDQFLGRPGKGTGGRKPQVVLWTDSFSDTLAPSVAQAAVAVLVDAGYEVLVPQDDACCGLTWISTGQLDGAKKQLTHLLGVLGPFAVNGIPIVGLEPSCTAVLRSDLRDLLPDDPRAVAVARETRTLAELLTAPAPIGPGDRWQVPGPVRRDRGRAAALPPPLGDDVDRRPPPAHRRRRAVLGARGLLRAGRQLRHGEGPLRRVGRGRGERAAARPCATRRPGTSTWRTASRAARRPTTWPACRACTWRSCSRRTCRLLVRSHPPRLAACSSPSPSPRSVRASP